MIEPQEHEADFEKETAWLRSSLSEKNAQIDALQAQLAEAHSYATRLASEAAANMQQRAKSAESKIVELKEALKPFAEAFNWLERLKEQDRDVSLGWLYATGPGSSGGYQIEESDLRHAYRAHNSARTALTLLPDGASEGRSVPDGFVLMTKEDADNLDELVHELGIENRDDNPAQVIRELKAKLERIAGASEGRGSA